MKSLWTDGRQAIRKAHLNLGLRWAKKSTRVPSATSLTSDTVAIIKCICAKLSYWLYHIHCWLRIKCSLYNVHKTWITLTQGLLILALLFWRRLINIVNVFLAMLFWRRRWKCEKFTDRRQTTGNQRRSLELPGELKTMEILLADRHMTTKTLLAKPVSISACFLNNTFAVALYFQMASTLGHLPH